MTTTLTFARATMVSQSVLLRAMGAADPQVQTRVVASVPATGEERLPGVRACGRTLDFHEPLVMRWFREDGFFVTVDESLGLRVFGETLVELRQAVADDLVFAWEQYVLEHPDRLHDSAKLVADRLRSLVCAAT